MNDKSMNKEKEKPKGLLIKILVPVLIVVVVAGIYFFKNLQQDDTFTQDTNKLDHADVDYSAPEFALDATRDFDLEEILSYGLPVMIDFGADSCIPCKEMAPILKELSEELRGKAIVKFVDVWENADAAQIIPLRVIPTQFFFDKEGNPYVPQSLEESFIMYEHQETGEHVFTAHEGGMDKDQILDVLKEMGVE